MIKTSEELKDFIVAALDNKKAESINVIELGNKTSLAKYMIFATGRSAKNISAIADYITLEIKHHSNVRTIIEGLGSADWVLIDAGDVIVHLFHPEARERYKLEELWG